MDLKLAALTILLLSLFSETGRNMVIATERQVFSILLLPFEMVIGICQKMK